MVRHFHHQHFKHCNTSLVHYVLSVLQAQAKLKELEASMVRHFQQHEERAGLGLELLPGVKALLEALQVGCKGTANRLMWHSRYRHSKWVDVAQRKG
jgi:hypothetical protein